MSPHNALHSDGRALLGPPVSAGVGQTGLGALGQGSLVSNANAAPLWLMYRNFVAIALALSSLLGARRAVAPGRTPRSR